MPKFLLLALLAAFCAALTACSENKVDFDFKPANTIDFQSLESKSNPQEQQAFEVLKNNLNALVKHDRNLFESGMATEKLAEDMKDYLDHKWLYKFTKIESVEKNQDIKNQFQITVIGERLDTSIKNLENLRLMYAIRYDDQGHWKIYTID
ncbi:hypothetical protein B9G55_12220 [Saccharibacillus sp. O16]|nr:hypothetical protein B9G55_12220 [Saccharibacillus sp. O16]